MGLLAQQVRLIADESIQLNDTTGYSSGSTHDWTTKKSQNITLTKKQLVFVKATVVLGATSHGAARILIGGNMYAVSGGRNNETKSFQAFVLLNAGTYTVAFQTAMWAGNSVNLSLCYVGLLNFADLSGDDAGGNAVSVANLETKTLLDAPPTIPAGRVTPAGTVKKYNMFVYIGALNDSDVGSEDRICAFRNPGEGDLAGKLNFKFYIKGTQAAFTERNPDYTSDASNPTYGRGAYGFYVATIDAGDSAATMTITVYNNYGGTRHVGWAIYVIVCPWIIPPTEFEPISLAFGQQSTLYITLEPLDLNPTKTVKIGKQRFISFGDATDYYSSASGAGIISHSYTFESVEVANSVMLVAGWGGCISAIGVDSR